MALLQNFQKTTHQIAESRFAGSMMRITDSIPIIGFLSLKAAELPAKKMWSSKDMLRKNLLPVRAMISAWE
jgi:hypothetical protein